MLRGKTRTKYTQIFTNFIYESLKELSKIFVVVGKILEVCFSLHSSIFSMKMYYFYIKKKC